MAVGTQRKDKRVVRNSLLTETNIRMLSISLRQVIPIPRDSRFDHLLKALDNPGAAR
jgi:hypothetical protein